MIKVIFHISGEYMDCGLNDADTAMEKDKIGSIPYKELDSTAISTKSSEDPVGSSGAGMALQSCHKLR